MQTLFAERTELACRLGADALMISGGETDVCVLAVMDAVDAGYRVIVVVEELSVASQTNPTTPCWAIRGALQPADRGRAVRGVPRRLARIVKTASAITCACAPTLQAHPA
jgi:hypothetical protein